MDIEKIIELNEISKNNTCNRLALLNYEYIVYDLKINAIKGKSLDKSYAIDSEVASLVIDLLLEQGFDAKQGMEINSGTMKKSLINIKSPVLVYDKTK